MTVKEYYEVAVLLSPEEREALAESFESDEDSEDSEDGSK